MTKIAIITVAAALVAILLGVDEAHAQLFAAARRPAPAPLLAAGIPAFVALGGGLGVTRLVHRLRRRRQSRPGDADSDPS